ncbi:hypothetical protein V7306_27545 [Neobacillus vireti]
MIVLSSIGGNIVARIPIDAGEAYQNFEGALEVKDAISSLFFQFKGTGKFDFKSFTLD